MNDSIGIEWLPKALVWALGQLVLGVVVVRRLARDRTGPTGGAASDASTAAWLAAALAVALVARAWAHTAAAFGTEGAWQLENLRLIAVESQWGRGWRLQGYAALTVLAGALAARWHRAGWTMLGGGAAALAVASPALGHAAGDIWRHSLHAAHHLATAVWLGTLGALTLRTWCLPAPPRSDADVIGRFSALAMCAAPIAVLTGLAAAATYVGTWEALATTRYGRTLLVKLVLVAGVLALGGFHWRRLRRQEAPTPATLRSEWGLAVLVLFVTAALSESEHP